MRNIHWARGIYGGGHQLPRSGITVLVPLVETDDRCCTATRLTVSLSILTASAGPEHELKAMCHASHMTNSVSECRFFPPYIKFTIKINRSKFRKQSIIAYGRNMGRHGVFKWKFFEILLMIPTKYLVFCWTGLTLSAIYSTNFPNLLIFIEIFLYHYEYSRHNRPVSVIFDSIPQISRRYFIFRWNVVTEV